MTSKTYSFVNSSSIGGQNTKVTSSCGEVLVYYHNDGYSTTLIVEYGVSILEVYKNRIILNLYNNKYIETKDLIHIFINPAKVSYFTTESREV